MGPQKANLGSILRQIVLTGRNIGNPHEMCTPDLQFFCPEINHLRRIETLFVRIIVLPRLIQMDGLYPKFASSAIPDRL